MPVSDQMFVKDILLEPKRILGDSNGFALGVQFYSCLQVCRIFDDTKQAFIRPSSDGDGLAQCPISAERLRWWHSTIPVGATISLHRGVHFGQVRSIAASLGDSAALGGHSRNIRSSYDEDARILSLLAVVQEEERAIDVNNYALFLFSPDFAYRIVVPYLRPVAIGRYSMSPPLDLIRDLGRHNGSD